MKSFKFLVLLTIFIVGCANTETDIQEVDEGMSIDNELNWSQGLGKSPEAVSYTHLTLPTMDSV